MTIVNSVVTAPGAIPVLGHAVAFLRDPLGFLESLPGHGDLVRIRAGSLQAYVVCDPELLHQVLMDDKTFDKGGPIYDSVFEVLGKGVVSCPYSVHRRQRRLTQPAFHRDRIPGYAAMMTEQIADMTESWHDGQRVDMVTAMSDLTARVATSTLFASDLTDREREQTRLDLTTLSQGVVSRMLMPQAIRALPTPGNRRYTKASVRIRARITKIVTDYRTDGVDHGDLLSMLIAARDDGTSLSDTEVHDNALIFLSPDSTPPRRPLPGRYTCWLSTPISKNGCTPRPTPRWPDARPRGQTCRNWH